MTQTLAEPISTFFRAKNLHDTDAMLECFTADAIVRDEGENLELQGKDAIRQWLEGSIARYKLTVEVTDAAQRDGETVVTAMVSGDFPGSPIEFYYHVRLEGDLIAQMAIR